MQQPEQFNPQTRDLYLNDVTPEAITELITCINAINTYESERFENDVASFEKIAHERGIDLPEGTEIKGGDIEPIRLHINSYGGSLYDCLSLISVIKNSQTPVIAFCHYAMSAGALITSVCHHRIGYELSTVMIHNLSSASWGQLQTMKEDITEMNRLEKLIIKLLTAHTKISKQKLKSLFEKKIDWYIPAEEALELGIFDEIYEQKGGEPTDELPA